MADDPQDIKPGAVDTALSNMKLEEEASLENHGSVVNGASEQAPTPSAREDSQPPTHSIAKLRTQSRSRSRSPVKKQSASPSLKSEDEEIIGGDIILKEEDGSKAKLSRKASQKVVSRPAPLFDHLADSTDEAVSVFTAIENCIYANKYMGYSDSEAMGCECDPEWSDGKNHACGEDSDCINRMTKMECIDGDCNCGDKCQNQRFQRKQWSEVSVIKTEKKGYGLRANTDLHADDFVFEYIGEVITEPMFRKRTRDYNEEGIIHFYFMSLSKNEFIDATKKGNLGRFCNHSCNPNCYVDKWVVGEKLRMGIFAKRSIKAGEELVFDYNVDRYGAEPQACYCGELNCSGFLGGKTQTERATKLSLATIEALGIDDGDGWDAAVAKRPRKKKTGEDDEEYVSSVQPKGLDEDGVRKIMATLVQCKEKWIVIKLLTRIQKCNDEKVRNKVVQMHGYQILRTSLTTWKDDNNVVLQIFDILYSFPRLTKNKITKAKIEEVVRTFTGSEHQDIAFEAKRLLDVWAELKEEYRIGKKKVDPNAAKIFDRRPVERDTEVTKPSTPATVTLPTGPRSNIPQRTFVQRPPIRRPINNFNTPLPVGWFEAFDQNLGRPYWYNRNGATTWQRPTIPAAEPTQPPQPSESVRQKQALEALISGIIAEKAKPASSTPTHATPTAESTPKKKEKSVEKWRSLPLEKQMKLYENTLFPTIKYVMQKFSKHLPKDDLKKFAKEIGKKLVASDFKNNRVEDPTKISEKQEKKVKKHVREFFERAVEKRKALDKRKKEKLALANETSSSHINGKPASPVNGHKEGSLAPEPEPEDEVDYSDHESPMPDSPSIPPATPVTGSSTDLKRKRDDGDEPETPNGIDDDGSNKRLKEESEETNVPEPPPPPPPPSGDFLDEGEGEGEGEDEAIEAGGEVMDIFTSNMDAFATNNDMIGHANKPKPQQETEQDRELRRQEEELQRENEEAMQLDMDGKLGPALGVGVGEYNGNGSSATKDITMGDDHLVAVREPEMVQ